MKKKLLAILMAMVMTLAFAVVITGCGDSDDEQAGEVTEEVTEAAAEEHAEATNIYEAIGGQYMDKVSERASAVVSADLESDCVTINVSWASSATEVTEWVMHATMNGDNQLEYNDCVKKLIVTDEDGNTVSEEDQYSGGTGYFEYADNGELKWTGAQDEECTGCIFVPIE